jgi:cytochrome P450
MSGAYFPPAPDHVPPERIVDFDFFAVPPGLEDPLEIWRELLRRDVPHIFYTPRNGGHWVFLDYADVVEGYRNHALFSTYQTPIPPLDPFPVVQPQGVDPPEHNVFRRLLAPLFTPIAIRALGDELRSRAQKLIEPLAARGSCDFITDYAEKLPTGMFLHLMDFEEERLPEFLALSNTFFRSTDPEERGRNLEEIFAVLNAHLSAKREKPWDDLASAIACGTDKAGNPLPWGDILNCGFLLFVAGLDTVTNTMGYIWRYLAATPEARAYFRRYADDRAMLQSGIEELLRINAVSNLFRRCQSDFVYKGVQFRRNDRVVLPNNIANRDASIFERPDEIKLDRAVNTHVTFGVGPHRCVGSHLAKHEIMISLIEWFARIPDFELAPRTGDVGAFGGSVMGFRTLPLRWTV